MNRSGTAARASPNVDRVDKAGVGIVATAVNADNSLLPHDGMGRTLFK